MNAVLLGLLALSIVLIEVLIGGTRLVFSLPSYGLVAGAAILSLACLRRDAARPSTPCLAVTAVFVAYIMARAAASPWDYLWWTDYYQILATVVVYLLVALYLTKSAHRMWFLGILFALATVEFFMGLRQFRGMDEWMALPFITRAPTGARASGTLISSIHYAGLLEAIGPFALATAFWSRWAGWARGIAGTAALLCYAGVAISGSRGAYLSSLFSLLVFGLVSFYIVRRARPTRLATVAAYTGIGAVAAFVGAFVLMSQSPMISKRLDLLASQDLRIIEHATAPKEGGKPLPGMDIRVKLWEAGIDQFKLAPVFGTGAGTYLYYGRLFRRPVVQGDPVHVHSDYLEILAEYGIVGAAGMLLFLGVHLAAGARRLTHILRTEMIDLDDYTPARNNDLALLVGALAAIAAYIAHSVVDFNLHIPGHSMIFGFIFAILASPRASESDALAPGKSETIFRFALPALGIWLAISGLGKFAGEYWCETGRQALKHRNFPVAIDHLNRALAREQRNPELYFHFGEAHRGLALTMAAIAPERRKNLLTAIEAYDRALAIFPLDEHVIVRKAQVLDELGKFGEARNLYLLAIEHDPNLAVLRAYFAQHLYRVGRAGEAEEQYKSARYLEHQKLKTIVDTHFLDAKIEPPRPASTPQ